MQIHEITYRQINEAAPGSFGGQAGVYGAALGQALAQKVMPGINLKSQQPMATDPQAVAKLMSDPVVKELANKQAALWHTIVLDLMKKNNVVDVKDLQPNVLKNALNQQVNTKLLTTISGNQITDFRDLTDKVNATDPETKRAADNLIRATSVAMDSILATEPIKQNTAKLVTAWNSLVANIYTAANMVKFQSGSGAPAPAGAKVPAGQRLKVTVNNTDYYKNAQGTWTNVMGQAIPNQSQIDFLEKQAATGKATLERA